MSDFFSNKNRHPQEKLLEQFTSYSKANSAVLKNPIPKNCSQSMELNHILNYDETKQFQTAMSCPNPQDGWRNYEEKSEDDEWRENEEFRKDEIQANKSWSSGQLQCQPGSRLDQSEGLPLLRESKTNNEGDMAEDKRYFFSQQDISDQGISAIQISPIIGPAEKRIKMKPNLQKNYMSLEKLQLKCQITSNSGSNSGSLAQSQQLGQSMNNQERKNSQLPGNVTDKLSDVLDTKDQNGLSAEQIQNQFSSILESLKKTTATTTSNAMILSNSLTSQSNQAQNVHAGSYHAVVQTPGDDKKQLPQPNSIANERSKSITNPNRSTSNLHVQVISQTEISSKMRQESSAEEQKQENILQYLLSSGNQETNNNHNSIKPRNQQSQQHQHLQREKSETRSQGNLHSKVGKSQEKRQENINHTTEDKSVKVRLSRQEEQNLVNKLFKDAGRRQNIQAMHQNMKKLEQEEMERPLEGLRDNRKSLETKPRVNYAQKVSIKEPIPPTNSKTNLLAKQRSNCSIISMDKNQQNISKDIKPYAKPLRTTQSSSQGRIKTFITQSNNNHQPCALKKAISPLLKVGSINQRSQSNILRQPKKSTELRQQSQLNSTQLALLDFQNQVPVHQIQASSPHVRAKTQPQYFTPSKQLPERIPEVSSQVNYLYSEETNHKQCGNEFDLQSHGMIPAQTGEIKVNNGQQQLHPKDSKLDEMIPYPADENANLSANASNINLSRISGFTAGQTTNGKPNEEPASYLKQLQRLSRDIGGSSSSSSGNIARKLGLEFCEQDEAKQVQGKKANIYKSLKRSDSYFREVNPSALTTLNQNCLRLNRQMNYQFTSNSTKNSHNSINVNTTNNHNNNINSSKNSSLNHSLLSSNCFLSSKRPQNSNQMSPMNEHAQFFRCNASPLVHSSHKQSDNYTQQRQQQHLQHGPKQQQQLQQDHCSRIIPQSIKTSNFNLTNNNDNNKQIDNFNIHQQSNLSNAVNAPNSNNNNNNRMDSNGNNITINLQHKIAASRDDDASSQQNKETKLESINQFISENPDFINFMIQQYNLLQSSGGWQAPKQIPKTIDLLDLDEKEQSNNAEPFNSISISEMEPSRLSESLPASSCFSASQGGSVQFSQLQKYVMPNQYQQQGQQQLPQQQSALFYPSNQE